MNRRKVAELVRQIMTSLGTVLITYGAVDESMWVALSGSLPVTISLVWAVITNEDLDVDA